MGWRRRICLGLSWRCKESHLRQWDSNDPLRCSTHRHNHEELPSEVPVEKGKEKIQTKNICKSASILQRRYLILFVEKELLITKHYVGPLGLLQSKFHHTGQTTKGCRFPWLEKKVVNMCPIVWSPLFGQRLRRGQWPMLSQIPPPAPAPPPPLPPLRPKS